MHSCSEGRELILAQVMRGGRQSDFHVVDLKSQKIRKTPVAILLNEIGLGATVRLGSFVYNFCGKTTADSDRFRNLDHHIHLGASSVELSKSHLLSLLNHCDDDDDDDDYEYESSSSSSSKFIRWKDAPHPNYHWADLCCASLGGKIYAFGSTAPERCIGEEFMPQCGEWKLLPQPPNDLPLQRFCVSYPVIPDENNQRLLVYFNSAHALYAYYPASGTWDCLAHNYRLWFPATALVDGVLYSHMEYSETFDCLVAYDVLNKSWLKVVYSDYFPGNICFSEFIDMLHLGNDMLCLANFIPYFEEAKLQRTYLQFVKFTAKRTSPTEVLVTLVAVNRFPLRKYLSSIHFIAL